MSKQCKCGKGYASLWDNKCGNCRTKKEQKDHQYALNHIDLTTGMAISEAYKHVRKVIK